MGSYHPSIWTYNPDTLRTSPYAFKDSVATVIKFAVGDQLAMYSLLSASTSRFQHIDRRSFESSLDKEHFYMERALQLMQERIGRKSADPLATYKLIVCIMFLGSAEAYRDNFEAARIHLRTVLRLLEPGGVMDIADRNLQGQLLMFDLFVACMDMNPPYISGRSYDPGPAKTLDLTEEELLPPEGSNHGSILLQKDSIILPAPLRQLVRDILETYQCNCALNLESMTPERALQTTHWVTKRNMAIRARLLETVPVDPRVYSLKLSTIMWTLLAMNITGT